MYKYNHFKIWFFETFLSWYYNRKPILAADLNQLVDVELDGIDTRDYPDFCDAFVYSAAWPNGILLTDKQLDQLNNDYNEYVYEKVIEYIY